MVFPLKETLATSLWHPTLGRPEFFYFRLSELTIRLIALSGPVPGEFISPLLNSSVVGRLHNQAIMQISRLHQSLFHQETIPLHEKIIILIFFVKRFPSDLHSPSISPRYRNSVKYFISSSSFLGLKIYVTIATGTDGLTLRHEVVSIC